MHSNVSKSPPEGDVREQLRAMAITALGPAGEQVAAQQTSRLVTSHIWMVVLLTVAIAGAMVVYLLGGGAANLSGPVLAVVLGPVLVILVLGMAAVGPRMRRARAVSDAGLAPLGLRVSSMPKITHDPSRPMGGGPGLVGATILSGERYGRTLEIVLETAMYRTVVKGEYPRFAVAVTGSGLAGPKGTPIPVIEVIGSLTGNRWKGVEVRGGPGGISVQRRVRGNQAKDGLWLSDLWLAERLADEFSGTRRTGHVQP